jgi:hypothetical protein
VLSFTSKFHSSQFCGFSAYGQGFLHNMMEHT